MLYTNPHTGARVDLGRLTDAEKPLYLEALRRFAQNVDWMEFHTFAFASKSQLYAGRRSYHDVVGLPLFKALEDMWLQLGVQQGRVSRPRQATQGHREHAHA